MVPVYRHGYNQEKHYSIEGKGCHRREQDHFLGEVCIRTWFDEPHSTSSRSKGLSPEVITLTAVCDSSCALGCFPIACRVQMCTDSRQELRTGRQALFYRNVLCIAIHSWSSPAVRTWILFTREAGGSSRSGRDSWRCMQKYAQSGVDLISGSPYHRANLQS